MAKIRKKITKTEVVSWGAVGTILLIATILVNQKELFSAFGLPDHYFVYAGDIIALILLTLRTIHKKTK